MTTVRDVMVVLLGSVILQMEVHKAMTVGQAADAMLKALDREGYMIVRKESRR